MGVILSLAANPATAQAEDNPARLLSAARIAAGKGDYAAAAAKYQRLHTQNPANDEFLLSLARVESWRGNLDEAVRLFTEYLGRHADDKGALLSYAYAEAWRGGHAEALDLLERYRRLAGETAEYKKARALFLAYASRSDESLALTDEYLQKNPRDGDALVSRVIALKEARRMDEALDSLEQVKKIKPDDKSVRDLERTVKAPLRSSVQADALFSSDSDTVTTRAVRLEGNYAVSPGFYLKAGIQDGFLRANNGSGLETVGGRERLDNYAAWVGADYAANRDFWLHGRIGQSDTDATDSVAIYSAGADYRPADAFLVRASVDHDFHAASPRAMSLDITRTDSQIHATWRPDLRYTVETNAGYAFFSDDNERWNLEVAPRRSIFRTEKYNLDLGVDARWFGFSRNLANGYYDPANYQQYLLAAYSYIKISDDSGVSFVVAPGIHRDDSFNSYKLSGNYSAEGVFGIDRDWTVKLRAGFVDNIGVQGGPYLQRAAGINLTGRF
jgi:tetratricopeptide (TPR) repeat protein